VKTHPSPLHEDAAVASVTAVVPAATGQHHGSKD
jgi:hypothetical protein